MRSQDFLAGASYQLNLQQNNGVIEKTKQAVPLVDITDFDQTLYIAEFKKSDGTLQTMVFGLIGSDIKLRVIEDGSILTPTGGDGDFTFTGIVTARQVGTAALIGHGGGAKQWDGVKIDPLAGAASVSIARDGSRLGYIGTDGTAHFTDNTPADGFTGGTGANADGDYNVGFALATAIIEAGTGVIIFGENAIEAHWVQPNNASDKVSSRTKIESFSYRGRGVKTERFATSTGNTIAFMNEDGVFEMNSYTGEATNLIIGGDIERYWNEKIDMTNGFIAYDQENDAIIAQVALGSPQNNVFLIFYRREKNAPGIISDQYLNHAGVVGGNLIGGSNSSGETTTLFESFSTPDGTTNKTRYITEFDGLAALQTIKNLQSVTAILQMSPDAIVKMRAYYDNETTPSLEKIITAEDLTDPDCGATYGEYVFSLGASDLIQEQVIRGEKVKTGMRFNTIAIEILEESSAGFKIYDIIVEYKAGSLVSKTMSLKNNLF
jgi:hypothetical protein